MIVLRKMMKNDVPTLYDIALRAFRPDYNQYGFYPPFMKTKTKSFLPPLMLGKAILADDTIIGGAFVVGVGKKGEIGTIFIDPVHQKKGYGKQAMLMIEKTYPRITKWKLDVLAGNEHLHEFYESLGYERIGEMTDKTSGLNGFVYEKTIG
ncbi:MAG: GNAT family N-acetyltransferase [Eubacteriales bacterium]|nr:GNAT family N-acetyltransferase [Eubacteriales bacterium]